MSIRKVVSFNDYRHVSVGSGAALPICGDVVGGVRCRSDPTHFEHLYVSGCRTATCPTCWPRWVHRAAVAATERYMAYCNAGGALLAPRHVVISPPPGLFESPPGGAAVTVADQVRAMRKFSRAASAIAQRLGFSAAVGLDHAYRLLNGADYCDSTATDRYAYSLASATPSAYLRFSPHRHFIVHGPLPNSAAFFAATGWVLKNISGMYHEAPVLSLADVEVSVGRRLHYLLGHAWVLGNGRVVRYFGGVSFKALRGVVVESGLEPIVCPVCGSVGVGFLRYGDHDVQHSPYGYARTVVREYTYTWRGCRGLWRTGIGAYQSVLNLGV